MHLPRDADISSSDEPENETRLSESEPTRKKRRRPSFREKSSQVESMEDIMKAMLLLLCKKVDKNNRALKEIQMQQHSR